MHAIEAKTEEMFGLLFRPPPYPAGRLVGADDEWQARDRYDVTTLIDGIGLSQLALRGACHDWCVWRTLARLCGVALWGGLVDTLSKASEGWLHPVHLVQGPAGRNRRAAVRNTVAQQLPVPVRSRPIRGTARCSRGVRARVGPRRPHV